MALALVADAKADRRTEQKKSLLQQSRVQEAQQKQAKVVSLILWSETRCVSDNRSNATATFTCAGVCQLLKQSSWKLSSTIKPIENWKRYLHQPRKIQYPQEVSLLPLLMHNCLRCHPVDPDLYRRYKETKLQRKLAKKKSKIDYKTEKRISKDNYKQDKKAEKLKLKAELRGNFWVIHFHHCFLVQATWLTSYSCTPRRKESANFKKNGQMGFWMPSSQSTCRYQ